MKTLLHPDRNVMSAIGDGKLPPLGTLCRPSLFALPVRLGSASRVFNTFTRQLIDAEELTQLFSEPHEFIYTGDNGTIDELIGSRFIVRSDANEAALFSSAIKILHLLSPKDTKKHGSFVILPTTACNARCFYCFENGIEYKTMDDATADATVEYILKTKTEGAISIRWFGGEPLVAERVIDRIIAGLNDNGVGFVSDIITNASLMTRELAEKAVKQWHVNSAQITLDGRKCEYHKRKAYVDRDRDHYTAALDAAKALTDFGAAVNFRLNADENNVDELFLLADELAEVFKGNKRISIYPFDMFASPVSRISDEANDRLYSRLIELQEKLKALGMLAGEFAGRLRTHRCMVDTPNGSSVITPNGDLFCCEHLVDEAKIGSLFDYENESEPRRRFIEDNLREKKCPECLHCVYLPECTQGAFCPSMLRDCRRNAYLMIVKKLLTLENKVL